MSKKYKPDVPMEPEVVVEEILEELVSISQANDEYNDQVQDDEVIAAKSLTGFGEVLDVPPDVVERMIRHGIAADMGDGLIARGFKWAQFVK